MKAKSVITRHDAALSANCRPVRLLLCDDQRFIRAQVRQLFQGAVSIRVVGEAASGKEAIRMALELQPDLVLMDVCMPDLDGIEATRQILTAAPQIRVLAFSADSTAETMQKMFDAGAHGYLLKTGDLVEIMTGAQEVLEGRRFVSSGVGESSRRAGHD